MHAPLSAEFGVASDADPELGQSEHTGESMGCSHSAVVLLSRLEAVLGFLESGAVKSRVRLALRIEPFLNDNPQALPRWHG